MVACKVIDSPGLMVTSLVLESPVVGKMLSANI